MGLRDMEDRVRSTYIKCELQKEENRAETISKKYWLRIF